MTQEVICLLCTNPTKNPPYCIECDMSGRSREHANRGKKSDVFVIGDRIKVKKTVFGDKRGRIGLITSVRRNVYNQVVYVVWGIEGGAFLGELVSDDIELFLDTKQTARIG